jgi:hypothetical protein
MRRSHRIIGASDARDDSESTDPEATKIAEMIRLDSANRDQWSWRRESHGRFEGFEPAGVEFRIF